MLTTICHVGLTNTEYAKQPNAGLQLRRALSIQAEGIGLLEKHAIAPSAARLVMLRAPRWLGERTSDRGSFSLPHLRFVAPPPNTTLAITDDTPTAASVARTSRTSKV